LVGLFRELPDLSITSFGIPWDQAVPVANCALNELAGYVYDEQNRVKLQNTPQMDLVSLVETSKFCTAGCALPYCRAKVRESRLASCVHTFTFGLVLLLSRWRKAM
jgi:hypothetical protein